MVFNDNNQNYGDSIFTDPLASEEMTQHAAQPANLQKENAILKIFNTFVNKFIEEPKLKREQKKFIDAGQKMLSEYEDILNLFCDSGCEIIINDNNVELEYPQLKLKGIITFQNGEPVFDENTQKILSHISNLIINANKLDDIMNKHEDEGFYPSGDLVNETIKLNGNEVKVLAGEMMNKQGQTKKIYYYKGKEVQPDKK